MSNPTAIISSSRATLVQWLVVCCAIVLLQTAAAAHELRPTIVDATIDNSGGIEVRAAMNLEAWLAGISKEHADTKQSDKASIYDRLRSSAATVLVSDAKARQDELARGLNLLSGSDRVNLQLSGVEVPAVGDVAVSRTSILIFAGELPKTARALVWQADASFGDTVIRVSRSGDVKPFYAELVSAGAASSEIALDGVLALPVFESLIRYALIGFEHIIPKGLDHILFIVGLFLLSPYLRPLLWQVTGFTLAHSVTLALGIYGLVSVPASIIEPLIALSIAFIAIENLFTDKLKRWRPAVVFGFGLLHGLGFASVLGEIGLPQSQFATALIGFNIGVELGQLAVLAVCFLGVGLWFRQRSWYRPAVTMPASIAVALIAMVWFVERIA